jgi:hypothetical protein
MNVKRSAKKGQLCVLKEFCFFAMTHILLNHKVDSIKLYLIQFMDLYSTDHLLFTFLLAPVGRIIDLP